MRSSIGGQHLLDREKGLLLVQLLMTISRGAFSGAASTNAYETTARIEEQGQMHLIGIPFAPGTEVEVKIRPKTQPVEAASQDDATVAAARERMRDLFATITGFRNSPRIPREELYDRGSLR